MRFKAKLAHEQLNMLFQVINPMSRIASTSLGSTSGTSGDGASLLGSCWTRNGSVVSIDDTFLRLSTKGSSVDHICCFAELVAHDIFLDHRIQSVAAENAIVMEVDLVQLRMAIQSICQELKSEKSSNTIGLHTNRLGGGGAVAFSDQSVTVIKLAKRNNIPCLCLDATMSVTGIAVHHSIPVRILRTDQMKQYYPPVMDREPDVRLHLAPEKPLRPLVEGCRAMNCPVVYLKATSTGHVTITVERDGTSIRSFFQQLAASETEGNDNTNRKQSECTVKVDTKKLCASLQWQQPHLQSILSTAVMCLMENEVLVIHVVLHPQSVGSFTYYVPVQYLPTDPTEE